MVPDIVSKLSLASLIFFALSVIFEAIYTRLILRKRGYYRVNDTINSMAYGMVGQLTNLIFLPSFLFKVPYLFILVNIGLPMNIFNIRDLEQATFFDHLKVFLIHDFLYHISHRLMHEINFMWAAHSIHHSSENMNFSTSLRQASFEVLVHTWLSLPGKAIAGIPYDMQLFHSLINTLGQFWVHTQFIGDLGILEYIINTPKKHIVHHARVPSMCNRNYGGVLAIWDWMFGTLELNYKCKNFGVLDATKNWNPVIMNYSNFWNLWKRSLKCKSLQSKISLIFYRNQGRWDTQVLKDGRLNTSYTRYNPDMSGEQKIYCMVTFLWMVVEYVVSMSDFSTLLFWQQCLIGGYACAGLCSITFYMDNVKGVGKYCEMMRIVTTVIIIPCFAIMCDYDESSFIHCLFSNNLMSIMAKHFLKN